MKKFNILKKALKTQSERLDKIEKVLNIKQSVAEETLTENNEKFETLADWQREFPKSFNKFHDETEYYRELKNGNVDIWFLLSEILDFFNEKSFQFESHYFFGSHDYSWQVDGMEEVEGATRQEAFLKCLQKLLQEYEKTL